MKNRDRFLLMTDFMMGRIKLLVLSVLLTICTFLLFDMVLTLMKEQSFEYDTYIDGYKSGIDDVYKIDFQYMNMTSPPRLLYEQTSYMDFLEDIRSIDGVKFVCGYDYSRVRFDELSRSEEYEYIMSTRRVDELELGIMSNDSLALIVDDDCMNYFMLKCSDDYLADFLSASDGYWPVLAGSSFSDILSIGDILHYGDKSCRIVGFLDPDATWPNNNGLGTYFYKTNSLNYQFVFRSSDMRSVRTTPPLNALYMKLDKSADSIQVERQVRNIGNDYNIILSMVSVDSILADSASDKMAAEKMYMKLLIFMFVLCILTSTASAVISLMVQRKKIGIWYASGILPFDVQAMIFAEQFIKIVLSAVLAYGIGIWYARECSVTYQLMHSTITLRWFLLLSLISYIVTVAVPCAYISRQHIIDLLQVKD